MDRPWWYEDNKVNFEAEGYKCYMARGPFGSWCGYVGIPMSHPWHGKTYNHCIKPDKNMLGPRDPDDHSAIDLLCAALSSKDINEELPIGLAMRIHGGLTYSNDHKPMCEPDGLWWFGFDCAHVGDLVPSFAESELLRGTTRGDIYRTQSYVVSEVQSLAAQLAKIERDKSAK